MIKVSVVREDGRESILTVLEPGNWFGEVSMVDGEPRSHDMVAVKPVELRRVKRLDFDQMLRRYGFCLAIARLQARHIRAACAMTPDARRTVHVSQEALAMMPGIKRQTLALELKYVETAEMIALSYRCINIVSPQRLRLLGNEI